MAADSDLSNKDESEYTEDEYKAYVRSVNPLITCDLCGEQYPKSDMRQCARCGMIVCSVCWPKHRCKVNATPINPVNGNLVPKENPSSDSLFIRMRNNVENMYQKHKKPILVGAVGLIVLIIFLIIIFGIFAGGHDSVEGVWRTTDSLSASTLMLFPDGKGTLYQVSSGFNLAYDVSWRKVNNVYYQYSISIGNMWFPDGNTHISEDGRIMTIGAGNSLTYLLDEPVSFNRVG